MFSKLIRKMYNLLLIPFTFKNWPQVIGYVLSIIFSIGDNKHKIGTVILRNGITLKIRLLNTLDLGSVMETHQRTIYTPLFMKIPENARIIDIGASIGDFGVFCASSFIDVHVYCFEPMKEAFELMQKNIKLNDYGEHIIPFNLAISDIEGTIRFGDHTYKAITIRKVFEQNCIDRCDLLKIDIEGAEYKVLLNTPVEVFNLINAIAMECHIVDTDKDLIALTNHLTKVGFNVKSTKITAHNICYLYATKHK